MPPWEWRAVISKIQSEAFHFHIGQRPPNMHAEVERGARLHDLRAMVEDMPPRRCCVLTNRRVRARGDSSRAGRLSANSRTQSASVWRLWRVRKLASSLPLAGRTFLCGVAEHIERE